MSDDEPQLDAFLRHLQAEVDSASEIVDKKEREERLFQLEVAIQEAIIFANRYRELQSQGVNPMMLVDPKIQADHPAPPTPKSQSILLRAHVCESCGKLLESDLDFCPACGAKK